MIHKLTRTLKIQIDRSRQMNIQIGRYINIYIQGVHRDADKSKLKFKVEIIIRN